MPLYRAVIVELLDHDKWSELNDRFYKTLAFGTGAYANTRGQMVLHARAVGNFDFVFRLEP